MTTSDDARPAAAVGHVRLAVTDLVAANGYFVDFGIRPIHLDADHAVLELRGGTHLVLKPADTPLAPGAPASFDLMVDDIEKARTECQARGLAPSAIEHRRVHDSFKVTGPDDCRITITSSHAGDRAV